MRPIQNLGLPALLAAALLIPACTGKTGSTGPAGPQGSSYPTPTPVCASPSSQGLTTVGTYNFDPVAGNLFAYPVTLATAETAVDISILAGSGAVTGQIWFGIYNDNGSHYPGSLVYQTNPQFLVANSWNQASLPALYLPAGTYWLAYVCSNNSNNFLGNSTGGGYYELYYGWASLPAAYPSSANGPYGPDFDFYLSTCP